ncbi:glycosyltransferase family 2 protein [Sinobacterium caligoides]|nr:glycosyltransferase [Sinobacterium caligoides]
MSVYNGAHYLKESIDSILNQTLTDFEFIIINDGSTDSSLDIIKSYNDKRITIVDQENKGLISSLNTGIALAKGEYIARMDADDISINDRFQHQIEYINKNNLDLCGGSIIRFGRKIQRKDYPCDNKSLKYGMLFLGKSFAHPTVMAKRTVMSQNPYDATFKHYEDFALWLKLIAIDNIRVGNTRKALLHYRSHDKQTSKVHHDVQKQNQLNMVIYAFKNQGINISTKDANVIVNTRNRLPSDLPSLIQHGEFLANIQEHFLHKWGENTTISEQWRKTCSINSGNGHAMFKAFRAAKIPPPPLLATIKLYLACLFKANKTH